MHMPGNVLIPADECTREYFGTLKFETGLKVKLTQYRNIRFHRKFFKMLRIGFDAWEAKALNDKYPDPQKNFDRFREDAVILAGFYDAHIRLNGDIRIEAKSISFAKMDEYEFNTVYSKVADVLLSRVLHNYTRGSLDNHVDQLMAMI